MKVSIRPALVSLLAGVALSVAVAGCGSANRTIAASSSSAGTSAPSFSLEKLRSAPPLTPVGSSTLRLTAELFRDTMPRIGPPDNTLSGAVTISTTDVSAIPAGLKLVAAYAVQGESSGSFGTLTPVTAGDVTGEMRASVATGPAYAPGSMASVVVLFEDAAGTQYLVQSASVLIVGAD